MPGPTLADVAARAGVSMTTASFAFNRPGRVAQPTQARVMAAAAELGYAGPNAAARTLRRARAFAIGFLSHERLGAMVTDPTCLDVIAGVAEELDRTGLALQLIPARTSDTGESLPDRGRIADAVVDGFIVYSAVARDPAVTAARARRAPLVLIDQPRLPDVPYVGIDDAGAARAAARHVLDLGHRRLLVLALRLRDDGRDGPVDAARERRIAYPVTAARLRGYRSAAEATDDGGAVRLEVIEQPGIAPAWAEAAVAARMAQPEPPTAILAMSDGMAQGAIRALARLGLDVPGDVSVVGFDDRPTAVGELPLTTVRQPSVEKGRLAARSLLAQLAGEPSLRALILPTELVIRASTGPPPDGR